MTDAAKMVAITIDESPLDVLCLACGELH